MKDERKRFPQLAYNWISGAGAVVALVAGITMAFLLVFSFTMEEDHNPYFGIFLYMVMPAVLTFGLILVPVGMFRSWRRFRKGEGGQPRRWPSVDLNRSSHRNAIVVFVVGTVFFVLISAVGSYEAYHYSESVEFCGTTCHTVMEPEFTTYQESPHARVACTECHVGAGADWYVKSKLSGAYQIYANLAEIYPTPIPTPIESLRPAQQTCEQCHWPERNFGAQQRQFHHFMYDEDNTHWPIDMLIKTGGGDPRSGQTAGIHWHMNIGVEVTYVARDETRQEIPWVQVRDRRTGRVTVYQDESEPLTEEELAVAPRRVMDCMDCHNRPSHTFDSPDEAIDHRLLVGDIDREIPFVKEQAVKAMEEEYASKDEALEAIANRITEYYRTEQAAFYAASSVKVDNAVVAVQDAYSKTIFPAMKARWDVYPDNIGHFMYEGCMRCHDGEHVSEEGVVVTQSCTACHTILSQGSGELRQVASTQEGLEFLHPEDIGEMWQEVGCWECHTGTQP